MAARSLLLLALAIALVASADALRKGDGTAYSGEDPGLRCNCFGWGCPPRAGAHAHCRRVRRSHGRAASWCLLAAACFEQCWRAEQRQQGQLGPSESRPTTSTRPQTDLCSSSCIFKFQSPSSLTPSLLPSGAYEKNKTGFNSCQFGKLSAKWEKYYGALPSHKFNRKKVRGVGADSTWAAASSRAAAGDECQHEARLSMCRPSHAPCAALRQVRSDSRC